jgi:hypothetical protein
LKVSSTPRRFLFTGDDMTEPIKTGARNNADDKGRIREARKSAQRIVDLTREMEPDDDDAEPGAMLAKFLGCEDKPLKSDVVLEMGAAYFDLTTVKAANDWELEVLGIPFGGPFDGKDEHRQFFSAKTEIYQKFFNKIPVFYYHTVQPDGKSLQPMPVLIGEAVYDRKDDRGHWFKVILKQGEALARRVWDAAKAGMARASSGSASHLVRVGNGGEILSWAPVELTLLDYTEKRRPANLYAVALPVVKAAYEKAGIECLIQPEANGTGASETGAADNQPTKSVRGVIEMDEKELLDLLDKRDALKASAAAEALKASEIETLRKENDALKAAANRLPGGAPHVREYADTDKYDGLTAADTALVIDALKSAGKPVSVGAVKALALKVARESDGYAKTNLKAAGFGDLSDAAIKAATDPMTAAGSLTGADWVGTAYSNQIWEAIRAQAQVVAKIPSVVIPDGYSSEYFPIESSDPTWYKVAETTAADSTMKFPVASVTASQMATAAKQITVAKMGARVMYSGELVEDSLINFAPQLRMQLSKSGAEMMERVAIDGDTATSANINDIGGTTYSGAATSLFLLTNGFRKSPLVTTTGQSRSAAGGFVIEDYINTLKLLGSNGLGASNLSECAFIVDPNVWFASMNLPEVKTRDVFSAATIENGFLTRIYGVQQIPSWFMHYASATRKANTAGKVDQDTAGNNAYGAILAVNFTQWKLAYKRRMTMEVTRFANSDSWEITALTRWGLGQRDTLAAAETYYVGI